MMCSSSKARRMGQEPGGTGIEWFQALSDNETWWAYEELVKNRRNNNKPENQGWSDIEDLQACLVSEGEPREK